MAREDLPGMTLSAVGCCSCRRRENASSSPRTDKFGVTFGNFLKFTPFLQIRDTSSYSRHIFFVFTIPGKPIVLECDEADEDLYPTVCSRKPDTEVVVNFGGKPFLYNLDHLEMIDDV